MALDPKTQAAYRLAAERLHHLSMRYVGAFAELAQGKEIAFLPDGTPGVSQMRDLIDLVLLCRAEVNGLTNLMHKAGIITEKDIAVEMTEQYEYYTKVKARQLGIGVTDVGITYDNPLYGKNN